MSPNVPRPETQCSGLCRLSSEHRPVTCHSGANSARASSTRRCTCSGSNIDAPPQSDLAGVGGARRVPRRPGSGPRLKNRGFEPFRAIGRGRQRPDVQAANGVTVPRLRTHWRLAHRGIDVRWPAMDTGELKGKIRDIKDFPTEGILFKDITTLLKDGPAFRYVIDTFVQRYR